jgi:PadR family transcriptional regulator
MALSRTHARILELLREGGAMYGLQLVKASDGALKRGSVYVTLGRMADKGLVLIEPDAEPDHAGMPRPRYRASSRGLGLLQAHAAFVRAMQGGTYETAR